MTRISEKYRYFRLMHFQLEYGAGPGPRQAGSGNPPTEHVSQTTPRHLDLRVLLVEDDPDTLILMQRLLERLSLRVVPSSSCAGARRAAEILGGLDLVITDEVLPDGRGARLAADLVRCYGGEAIVVSGTPPEASLPAGVRLWLTKPIDFTRLREAVLNLVA